jgi:uncharacterized protein YjiS (DUF1127 family)
MRNPTAQHDGITLERSPGLPAQWRRELPFTFADHPRGPATFAARTMAFIARLGRRLLASVRRWRQTRATYAALSGLDARTLRDLGFHPSEIGSVAAEIGGDADPTRVHAMQARFGPHV